LDVGLRSSAGKVGWHQANDLTTAIDDGSGHHHGGFPITHLFHALANAAGFSLDGIHTWFSFLHIHPTRQGIASFSHSFFSHPDHACAARARL
jgi:hypothetical protein